MIYLFDLYHCYWKKTSHLVYLLNTPSYAVTFGAKNKLPALLSLPSHTLDLTFGGYFLGFLLILLGYLELELGYFKLHGFN